MLLVSKSEGGALLREEEGQGVGEGGNLSITVGPRFFLFLCTLIMCVGTHFSSQRGRKPPGAGVLKPPGNPCLILILKRN